MEVFALQRWRTGAADFLARHGGDEIVTIDEGCFFWTSPSGELADILFTDCMGTSLPRTVRVDDPPQTLVLY